MASKPGVYWNESWNPVTGCTPCSPACDNCWAKATAERFPHTHGGWEECGACRPHNSACSYCRGTASVPVPFARVVLHPDRLDAPLHWTKPRVVAVCWMGDLFHPSVSVEYIEQVFLAMGRRYWAGRDELVWHTWLVLTKRAERMRDVVTAMVGSGITWREGCTGRLPPNVYLGVSVWDQGSADRDIPILLDTPAAHRWVSVEPMLGELSFRWSPYAHQVEGASYQQYLDKHRAVNQYEALRKLDQVIAGCESLSGRAGRPMPHGWARSVRDQCMQAEVPLYLKQMAEHEDGTGKVIHAPHLDGKQHLELAWEVK